MDINRNVLRKTGKPVSKKKEHEMNRFWGDDSWKGAAFKEDTLTLFDAPLIEKATNLDKET